MAEAAELGILEPVPGEKSVELCRKKGHRLILRHLCVLNTFEILCQPKYLCPAIKPLLLPLVIGHWKQILINKKKKPPPRYSSYT